MFLLEYYKFIFFYYNERFVWGFCFFVFFSYFWAIIIKNSFQPYTVQPNATLNLQLVIRSPISLALRKSVFVFVFVFNKISIMCEISHFNHIQLFVTLWTIAHQAPLSMGFSRQEYLRGLPCSIPGDLPDPGIKPTSLALQMDSLPLVLPGKPNVHDNPYQF